MSDSERFEIHAPEVVSECIDGEVIVVNLVNGHYFSLGGTAAFIWSLLMSAPRSFTGLLENLQSAYEGAEIAKELASFFTQLKKEGLIRRSETAVDVQEPEKSLSASRKPFSKPVIEKFSDMKEFLLVDPIHEVNVKGWPYLDKDSDSSKTPKDTDAS